MTIRFACRCGKKMKAADEKIGTKILCPECGSPVKIPESNTIKKETIGTGVAASELAGNLLRGSGGNKTPASDFNAQNQNQIAFEAQKKKPKSDFDPIGSLVDFCKTFVPAAAAIGLLVAVTYWISSSIMHRGMEIPQLAPVTGTITLGGKPLANAKIYYKVKQAGAGSNIATAMGKTDTNGTYVMSYLNDYEGAVVGLNKVWIEATDSNGRSLIATKYGGRTELKANVSDEGTNQFDYDLEPR